MGMDILNRKHFWIALLLFCFVFGFAHAQSGYPQYQDLYVNDFAGVMNEETITQVRSILADLRARTGIEAVVVTIQSIRDYGTGDDAIEPFATNLFNRWGVGDATRNDGVMILAAIRDRDIRIEVGAGYDAEMNDEMREVLDENILPYFRRSDYNTGLFEGTRAVIRAVTGEWPERITTSPDVADSTSFGGGAAYTPPTPPGVIALMLGGGGAVGLGGAALLYRRWTRYRPRKCPNCGDSMERLDEAADDLHLADGQKIEEMLAAIDYDVWRCPTCRATSVYPYPHMFSRHTTCPRCGHKTVSTGEYVLSSPTYTSTGSKKVTADCQNCDYKNEYTVTLPMLVRSTSYSSSSRRSSSSSSSRSSSFGGGRSSGGGASGKW